MVDKQTVLGRAIRKELKKRGISAAHTRAIEFWKPIVDAGDHWVVYLDSEITIKKKLTRGK